MTMLFWISDTAYSYVHDAFICVTLRMHTCETTHSYASPHEIDTIGTLKKVYVPCLLIKRPIFVGFFYKKI